MKIKTLVAAVLLLSGGATSVFAQNDCNAFGWSNQRFCTKRL